MSTPAPPRFVPTLTEVVEPTPAVQESAETVADDALYGRVLAHCAQQMNQYVDEHLDRLAREVFEQGLQQIRTQVQEQLRTQLEALVRQALSEPPNLDTHKTEHHGNQEEPHPT
ncbi:hypothetical protein [Candidatus Symbiobacter mobilis]|uniref:Uncharacterized protein n=1 Tax=Candidatus Symbiobacter mobilis CR TaxID=946483 RepID=U5NCY2_9BURK|nr:hypothetical protein [Candidatus Symbiobacter mobilis]AGX88098.1 hypothetical protein Cenrod_2026 [Candidatus Symbiobacter mobilis CR]